MALRDLECFASMDWGYHAFGCCLWWVCLTDGRYHIIGEYKFSQQSVEQVGAALVKKTKDLGLGRIRYVVGDPAMWARTGAGKGESIAETLGRPPIRLPMKKGDNDRLNGWQRVHELLRPMPDDSGPWLTFDPSCTYLRRTIPAAVSDKGDPDDVDTKIDDHGLDALRYGAMSRPSPTRMWQNREPPKGSAGSLLRTALVEAATQVA